MLNRILLTFVIILTLSACQSTPNTRARIDPSTTDPSALLTKAENTNSTSAAVDLRLQAAEIFIQQMQYNSALAALAPLRISSASTNGPGEPLSDYRRPQDKRPLDTSPLDTSPLDANRGDQVSRLRSAAYFGLGQFNTAEDTLSGLNTWQPEDMYLLGQICNAQGNYRCSADGYIQASIELGMDSEVLPADIHDRIWLALSRARQAPSVYTNRYHHGWWLLQENIRTAGSITNQIKAWRDWQNQYPSHPARLRPPEALRQLDVYQVPQIGLLLPLSGAYAAAGRAVRDGIIAAYLSENTADKPQIRFYDTGESGLPALYEQALNEGADVLVGPLIKSEVEAFVSLTEFASVPRLVLNYLSPLQTLQTTPSLGVENPLAMAPSAPLFQFGIAIEDEATSLASHVLLNGAEHLLVVHSQERWARRALDAYLESWPFAVTTAPFTDIKGLTEAVGEAMQVAASESRNNEIAQILGQPLEFLPRARGDLDAVVAFTSQVEARALVPALRFHFAHELPVYATSQVARGDNRASLDGFEITEMPLYTNPNATQKSLLDAFSLRDNPLGELYALGFDAYRLATWLPILDSQSQIALPAASGYLWLQPDGKFRRDLTLSRIQPNGSLLPLD